MKNKTLSIIFILLLHLSLASPVFAARDTDSFDGNIFPIYAGNGSLVPPASTLEQSLNNKRTSVLVFYLDDNSNSKIFAPVVSGIKLLWTSSIDIIPLTTDELQDNTTSNPTEPSYYWRGHIPQVVVINGDGKVILDEEGQVPIEDINQAISQATGKKPPEFSVVVKSYNEYNSEASKKGYTDPRK